jgi:hypothetical protein
MAAVNTPRVIGGRQLLVANVVCWSVITILLAVDLVASLLTGRYGLGRIPEMAALAALGYVAVETSRGRWTAALWQLATIGTLDVAAVRLVERKGAFVAQPYYLPGEAVAGGFVVILLCASLSGGLSDIRFRDARIAVNGRYPYGHSAWILYYVAVMLALVATVFYEIATLARNGSGISGILTALVRVVCLVALIGIRKTRWQQAAGRYPAELLRLLLIMWMLDWLRGLDALGGDIVAIGGLVARLTLVSSVLYIEEAHTSGHWEGPLREGLA